MTYFAGLGSSPTWPANVPLVGAPWWCSSAVPQGTCVPTPGVCKPMNPATLTVFQMLQRRANALLAKRKKPLIDVDGRIGASTVLAMRTISVSPSSITGCDVVAKESLGLLGALETQMAAEGATYVPDPASSRPSTPNPDGTVKHPPDRGIQLSPTAMVLVAVSIGAVVALSGTKKGKRR